MKEIAEDELEQQLISIFIKLEARKRKEESKTQDYNLPDTIVLSPKPDEPIILPFPTYAAIPQPEAPVVSSSAETNRQTEAPLVFPSAETNQKTTKETENSKETQLSVKLQTSEIVVLQQNDDEKPHPEIINKIASRGAEHTKNPMPHKKNRHEKGIAQRNKQKHAAEKRLLKSGFAYTGKVSFAKEKESLQ